MKEIIVKSISNTIFCRLTEALNLSGLRKLAGNLEFNYANSKQSSDKKLFGILKISTNGIDRVKLGMFFQAFSLLLEEENIKTSMEKKSDFYIISIFKPSKISKQEIKGVLNLKIEGEDKKIYCKHRPKKVYKHKIKVRFRDLDAMGHVSNNVFLVYLEEARVGFRDYVAKHNEGTLDFSSVVASHNIEYVAPIFLGEELEVEVFISHLTEKSYRFNYRIFNKKTKELKAVAYTQMVGYDYKKQVVKPIPKEFTLQMTDYIV